MKRIAIILTTIALATVGIAPASASAASQPPGVVVVSGIRACVSTTWRAQHTHQAKTRPGELCYVTEGMWIPATWHRIGIRLSADGSQAFEVWQRPW